MRTTRQSSFRQPLDEVLGTVSCVRILREMTLYGLPVGVSELAERTSLSRSTANETVARLVDLTVLEAVGTGRYAQYQLCESHFLAGPLQALFQQEDQRPGHVFEALREVAEQAEPRPTAVCLYGSVVRGEDRPGSDLDVLVVGASPAHRHALGDRFRVALTELEERWDLPACSVIVLTEDEIRDGARQGKEFFVNLGLDAAPIYGQLPAEVLIGG